MRFPVNRRDTFITLFYMSSFIWLQFCCCERDRVHVGDFPRLCYSCSVLIPTTKMTSQISKLEWYPLPLYPCKQFWHRHTLTSGHQRTTMPSPAFLPFITVKCSDSSSTLMKLIGGFVWVTSSSLAHYIFPVEFLVARNMGWTATVLPIKENGQPK